MISAKSDLANNQHNRHPMLILVVCLLILGTGAAAWFKLHSRNVQHNVAIPTSGNLCGNTNGRGAIVSVASDTITIKLDNGSTKNIALTSQTTIKTPSGADSISALKTGDRVTIVGSPNPDGSVTATDVLVCGVIQSNT